MVDIHKWHYNGPTTPRNAKARWDQCSRKNYDSGDREEGKNEDRPVAFPDSRNFDPEIGSLHFLEDASALGYVWTKVTHLLRCTPGDVIGEHMGEKCGCQVHTESAEEEQAGETHQAREPRGYE